MCSPTSGCFRILSPVRVRERAWLVENPVGDRQLADVVEPCRATKLASGPGVDSELYGDAGGDRGHTIAVLAGPGRFRADDIPKRLGDPVKPVLIGDQDPIGRLDGGHLRRGQRRPEVTVRAERDQRIDELGIEPSPASPQRHPAGGIDTADVVKDLHGLRQAQNPRRKRDLGALQPVRLAKAVPVLIQPPDRVRRPLGEAELARDLSALVAPRRHQRLRHGTLVADRPQTLGLRPQRPSGGDAPRRPHERRQRARPVNELRCPLGHLVVGTKQRRHVRRVGRAPGVLQQQRVEQIRPRVRRQAQLLGQAHPDQAGSLRVTRRLPLRDIQRARQTRDQLRQGDAAWVAPIPQCPTATPSTNAERLLSASRGPIVLDPRLQRTERQEQRRGHVRCPGPTSSRRTPARSTTSPPRSARRPSGSSNAEAGRCPSS